MVITVLLFLLLCACRMCWKSNKRSEEMLVVLVG